MTSPAHRIEANGERRASAGSAASFNTMLAALEESEPRQRQLVADASHELRTPLTSLRTNIEVLARDREHGGRRAGAAASTTSSSQLRRDDRTVIGELVELAREARRTPQRAARTSVSTSLAAEVVERDAAQTARHVEFVSELEPSRAARRPERRSLGRSPNLLDNAAKWSPPGGQGGGDGRAMDELIGARPRPGHRRRRPAVRVRPLLPRARPRAGFRVRASGSRSSSRWRSARRRAAPSGRGARYRMRLRPSGANGAGPQPTDNASRTRRDCPRRGLSL